ncbi:hypothetical protein L249_3921 [Ophiocordyceps polyrhachis-furcata BCC 54312]|uniref:Phospholipase/carboxylesterase/thioesterase domain-containing protein n=1 Tax=Ophiocordyceps polyrhachis-furcata BCC 54312 TaxID=1330021 RepID=A0A367L526_9HYPO|nr:hypothetical protein L249_3921 [Ophiocordyceps polyrhachis-furcata BCC 54312]
MSSPACVRDPHLTGDRIQSLTHVVNASHTHTHTFILLHDVGSNGSMFGHDLLRLGRTSTGKSLDWLFPGVRFVFPTAVRRPCQAFHQLRIGMWFNMAQLQQPCFRQDLQRDGMATSSRQIISVLRGEMRRLPAEKIIIGGLGQGAAMSLVVLLTLTFKLGGVIGMSGYLPFWFELQMMTADDSSDEDEDEDEDDEDDDDGDALYTEEDDQAEEKGAEERNKLCRSISPSLDPCIQAQLFARKLLNMCMPEHPSSENTSVGTPVFLAHNDNIEAVPVREGSQAASALEMVDYEVRFRYYHKPGQGYQVPMQIDGIVSFIRSKIGLIPRPE